MGNPPFIGAKYQKDAQREQVRRIAALGGSGGTLDYVAAWFLKAADYVRKSKAPFAFVATNSITQGEQAAQLWPLLLERKRMAISFAHKTFAWGSDARGKAHVHVVVIGLTHQDGAPDLRRLFSYADINADPVESTCRAISPYLFDASGLASPATVIHEAAQPLNDFPKLIIGSKPIDGGHMIFTDEERAAFLACEPGAAPWMRPFIGAEEYINGGRRWILALQEASPSALRALPCVMERIAAVKAKRLESESAPTRALADTPTLWHVNILPEAPFMVVPKVSSERREYIPIGWLEPPVIPSDLVHVALNATPDLFALLTSNMHMAWMRAIAGRLESRYRYSIGLVYNNFPVPDRTATQTGKLADLGRAILAARAKHSGETLAALYDPDAMPPDLRRAHQANDRFVDRLYRPEGFPSDAARVAHLFGLYEQRAVPMVAAAKAKPKRGRKAAP